MFPLHLLRRFPTARCVRSIRWTASNALDEQLIITNSCVKKLKQLQQKSADSALYLRISVESGGCSGFQYVFLVENKVISQEEDLVYDKDGCRVVVDKGSYELIKGATIDYQQEMIKSSFAVVNNPQSEKACGCGSSFAVKNFSQNPALD